MYNSCIVRDKFRDDETVQNVDKEHSEDLAAQLTVEVLRQYYRSSHNFQEVVWQCSCETGICETSGHHILQNERWIR
jgi:hypothetical protein